MEGDTASYLQSIDVLKEGIKSSDFVPNRIVTTFGGLQAIIFFSKIFSSILAGWFVLNHLLFFLSCFVLYRILFLIFGDKDTSLLGALFFAGGYATMNFGLAYLLDMGGWAFYVFSLYFCLKYILSGNKKYILMASALVGFGVLFKEYAGLGAFAVGFSVLYVHWGSIKESTKNLVLPVLFSSLPILTLYAWTYSKFGYTYLDWFSTNDVLYSYTFVTRISEYMKAFGSLFNIFGLVFLFGLYYLWKNWKTLDQKIKAFIVVTFLSFLPMFFWPAITQRILFVTAPFVVIVACFFINKFEKKIWIFTPVLAIYIVLSFMTDYLLYTVNLPF